MNRTLRAGDNMLGYGRVYIGTFNTYLFYAVWTWHNLSILKGYTEHYKLISVAVKRYFFLSN